MKRKMGDCPSNRCAINNAKCFQEWDFYLGSIGQKCHYLNSSSAQGPEHFYKIRSVREKSARWSPKRENKKDYSFSKMEITALHLMEEKVIS